MTRINRQLHKNEHAHDDVLLLLLHEITTIKTMSTTPHLEHCLQGLHAATLGGQVQWRSTEGKWHAVELILPNCTNCHGCAPLQQQGCNICIARDGSNVHGGHAQRRAAVDKAARAACILHLGGAEWHPAAIAFHTCGWIEQHMQHVYMAMVRCQLQAVVVVGLVLDKWVRPLLQKIPDNGRMPALAARCVVYLVNGGAPYPCLQAIISGVLYPPSLRLRQRWTLVVLRSVNALVWECCSLVGLL